MLTQDQWNASDACLKCTQCIAACPVYRADQSFLGPKRLGPEWWRQWQAGQHETLPHVEDCTFCQLCEQACPVDIPVAHLIAEHKSHAAAPWRRRLRDAMLTRPHWVARAPFVGSLHGPWDAWIGLGRKAARPRMRKPSRPTRPNAPPQVGLFVDCYSGAYDGGTLEAAESLLNVWGLSAVRLTDGYRCCGAAAHASGLPDQARSTARSTREALGSHWSRDFSSIEQVVTFNATCDGTIREEWSAALGVEPLSAPVVPFVEFSLRYAPPIFWTAIRGQVSSRIWTHATCRSRVHRGEGWIEALMRKLGQEAVPLNISCCGAAGSYAFKAEHEETAHRMGRAAWDPQMEATGDILLVDSGTCALHLAQITGLRAMHPAVWLWEQAQRTGYSKGVPGPTGQSDPSQTKGAVT